MFISKTLKTIVEAVLNLQLLEDVTVEGKKTESLTVCLPVEWDHRSAGWIPSQFPEAVDWWLYLHEYRKL